MRDNNHLQGQQHPLPRSTRGIIAAVLFFIPQSTTVNGDTRPSFTTPHHLEGYNSNRFIINGNPDDVENMARTEGAEIYDRMGHGMQSVIEFTDHARAESFKYNVASTNRHYTVEQDTPVYSMFAWPSLEETETNVTSSRHRHLQGESIPWGIEKVFEDDNGRPNIPPSSYYPSNLRRQICIIDSGYELEHPDLPTSAKPADPGQKSPANPDRDYFGKDTCYHGSHVAGTILASKNSRGVVGVYPGAESLIVKVFNGFTCGWTYRSSLQQAVEKCVSAGADIISMSLGGPYSSNTEKNFFKSVFNNDKVLVIAAAGNAGDSSMSYPASYDDVISVAATDSSDRRASFSQYNAQVDVSGPGVNIRSTIGNGDYKDYSGTSMATPHISGVALLLWNKYPNCDNDDIRKALEQGVDDLGSQGRDNMYGHGLVKYWKAEKALKNRGCDSGGGGGNDPPAPSPRPPTNRPPTNRPPTNRPPTNPSPTPPGANKKFEVKITTDNHGGDTTWYVRDGRKNIIKRGGPYSDNAHYTEELMLEPGEYRFKIKDDSNNGICCDFGRGSYELYIDGNKFESGGSFDKKEVIKFTVDEGKNNPSSNPPPSRSPPTPPAPTRDNDDSNDDRVEDEDEDDDCVNFELQLKTDDFGDEVSWFLKDMSSGPVTSGGKLDPHTWYTVTECLPKGSYKFTIKDTQGDGICCKHGNGSYEISLGGQLLKKGGEYRQKEKTYFDVKSSSGMRVSFGGNATSPINAMTCTRLALEIKTNKMSSGLSWELRDDANDDLILHHGDSYLEDTLYLEEECLPPGKYTFIFFDSSGNGLSWHYGYGYYLLNVDGEDIHRGQHFGYQDSVTFDTRTGDIEYAFLDH